MNLNKTKKLYTSKLIVTNDERHQKEQSKNTIVANQIEVKGKVHTIRKKIIHYYDLSREDDSKSSRELAELQKRKNKG